MSKAMPKKTPTTRSISKKGDEGLEKLMSPGVLSKVQAPPPEEPEKFNPPQPKPGVLGMETVESEEIGKLDFDSLIGAALLAIGIGVLIGLAFTFILRDTSAVAESVQESVNLADLIPQ